MRPALVLLGLLTLASCGQLEVVSPSSDVPETPFMDETAQGPVPIEEGLLGGEWIKVAPASFVAPMADYHDGRVPGGDRAFLWEPPLVRHQPSRGQFNDDVTTGLAVQVCRWDESGCAEVMHRVPGADGGSVQTAIRQNRGREFYTTSWVSSRDLPGRVLFRAEAYLHAFPLGYVEFMSVRTWDDLWYAWGRGLTAFIPGAHIPVRFRINEGVFEGPHNPVPILEVFDGRDPGGNPAFFWARPVARTDHPTQNFDEGLEGEISVFICGWVGTGCVAPIATIEGRGRKGVKRNKRRHYYEAKWDTRGIDPTMNYRAMVFVRGIYMGHADIDVVKRGFECAPTAPLNTYCVDEGATGSLRFYVAEGVGGGI